MKPFTIGHLAREAGINIETVRYYEQEGLLPKATRSASGYRLFSVNAAQRLRFIRRAQELGFSLKEIRELLALRLSPKTSCGEVRKRAEAKVADIEAKIKSLQSMSKSLRKLTQSCSGEAPISECPIMGCLDGEDS